MKELAIACLIAVIAGNVHPLRGQTVYRLTATSTFSQHADTVVWVRDRKPKPVPAATPPKASPPASHAAPRATADTTIYLIHGDTVTMLRPGPRRVVPAPLARHYINILNEAKHAEKIRKKM